MTGFASAFTNLRTGERCDDVNALLAAILADATNLGLGRMAAASHGVIVEFEHEIRFSRQYRTTGKSPEHLPI